MKEIILILEDEEDLLELLEFKLTQEDYETIGCLNTKNAYQILNEENISLMLVDRNLVGEEGSDFVKKIRKEGYKIPVIYLSAKDSDEDKIEGFKKGGDDYITKPFNFDELILRIQAVLRRFKGEVNDIYKYKNLILNHSIHCLNIDSTQIKLTPLESKLLILFFKNSGIVLSREYLLEHIWDNQGEIKSINVAIKRLRQKLDFDDEEKYIKSIRSQGYMFV